MDYSKYGKMSEETLKYLKGMFDDNNADEILTEVLDSIEDGVIVVDRNGRIFYLNDSYSKILHVDSGRIIGKLIQDIEPDSRLVKVLDSHQFESREFWKIPSLGTYVSMKIYPLFDNDVFIGAVSIFKDVTEIRNLNKEVDRISNLAEEYRDQIESMKALQASGIRTGNREMLKLFSQAETVAATDVPVLITGESGVGKEVFANYIYKCSKRSDKPLITVNCAAIPPELMESELFGYEEGSFTGAVKGGKKGKFELADGGTIFLDEIGEMPLLMQSKLLRVLQQGEIEKIGRQKRIPVDVRVIAATNQGLKEMIKEKRFREDLYFRLNTISINILPLRERKDDIPILTSAFLEEFNSKYDKDVRLTETQMRELESYNWPGNIRELRNYLERAVILGGDALQILPESNVAHADGDQVSAYKTIYAGTLSEQVKQFEEDVIRRTLEENNFDRMSTMQQLGISRRTFYRKTEDLDLK